MRTKGEIHVESLTHASQTWLPITITWRSSKNIDVWAPFPEVRIATVGLEYRLYKSPWVGLCPFPSSGPFRNFRM